MNTTQPAAMARDLSKIYGTGDSRVVALDNVSVDFHTGRFTAIMGPSGSGKSTLMHCVAGLDEPTSGRVWLGDAELSGLSDNDLTALRRDRVGFVFQAFNLLPTLTAWENITLPLDLVPRPGGFGTVLRGPASAGPARRRWRKARVQPGTRTSRRLASEQPDPRITAPTHLDGAPAGREPDRARADAIIDAVGLGERLHHRPNQLSGGQQQRVACARALITRPDVVFADEPTGALDSKASADLLGLLRDSVDDLGQTVVMVTHEPVAAAYADRVLFLADGRVVDELARPTAATVLDRMKNLEKVTV